MLDFYERDHKDLNLKSIKTTIDFFYNHHQQKKHDLHESLILIESYFGTCQAGSWSISRRGSKKSQVSSRRKTQTNTRGTKLKVLIKYEFKAMKLIRRLPKSFSLFMMMSALHNNNNGVGVGVATAMSMSSSGTAAPSKTALVTGSTDGIGVTTAKNLAKKGYNTIIHGRDANRIKKAVEEVKKFANISSSGGSSSKSKSNPKIYSVQADISTVNGCYSLVNSVKSILSADGLKLDVLMNNAGVFEQKFITTNDGLELTFAVNVMAPWVITSNLLPQLLLSPPPSTATEDQSRIVIASSISQCYSIDHWDDLQCEKRNYSAHRAYSESKLLDAMLAAEFATRLEGAGFERKRITCNSLDPGTVNTKMLLAGWGPCGINVRDALDQTWLCTSDEVNDITGTYFNWRNVSKSADKYLPSERQKLWSILSQIDPSSAEKWSTVSELNK